MKKILLNIVCLCSYIALFAQPSFTASTDNAEIVVGAPFEVKFTLSNGSCDDFKAPPFSDFNILGGPNKSSSVHIINGVSSSTLGFSYQLQAKKEGKYVIAPAKIRCGGKYLETLPIQIHVTKLPSSYSTTTKIPLDAKDAVFVRAEVNTTEARVGQQIVLDYKLYTRVSLSGVNLVKESDYEGFYKQDVNSYNHGESRIKLGGKDYTTKILQRIVLFPQKEGEKVVLPLYLQVGIVSSSGDPFDDFFKMGTTAQKNIQSNPVTIQVKALPENPPISFTGGVGSFDVQSSISRQEATTDDILSLKLTVVGNGDAKQWQAPKFAPVDGLEFYEPKVLSETPSDGHGLIETTKEWEYLIVPKKAGNYEVKPAFSYFDLKKNEYVTMQPATYALRIAQGTNPTAKIAATSVAQPKDIRFIKTKTSLSGLCDTFFGTMPYYILLALPFCGLLAAYLYKQQQAKLNSADVQVIKSQNAQKVAQRRLAIAEQHLKNGRKREFFDETSKTMFTYISDKLNIPLSEFSKNMVREKMGSLAIPSTHIDRFLKILQQCEMALFAQLDSDTKMQETYKDALQVITDIENNISRKI
ncbi:MAG: hypothetical protein RLZZ628_709 [Bacteroidota bacterium]|jgi:hypothetical protein